MDLRIAYTQSVILTGADNLAAAEAPPALVSGVSQQV